MTGARRMRWFTRLTLCMIVLFVLDNEEDQKLDVAQAITYWREALHPRARCWHPYLKDTGEMLDQSRDVRGWMVVELAG